MPDSDLTHRRVLSLAWPIVLAQVATALTGVVDTVVMGRVGTKEDLAAVAVASVTFSFLYWSFGFLRMATTGQTAQAQGAGQAAEGRAILVRALALGGGLGIAVAAMFPLLHDLALALFQASDDVEAGASAYMVARIAGAPAALTGFGIMGWLLGMGRTRALLGFQLVLNVTNAVLDAILVGVFDAGPAGIGMGTAAAEWIALGGGLWLVRDGLRDTATLLQRDRLVAMFSANRDIMIRTLALLGGFAWFVNSGAVVGDANLAGNQVLLQFIAVSAFVLDAFAFVAEKEAGEAVGARDGQRLRVAMRRTTELALAFGVLFSLAFFFAGAGIITRIVADPEARAAALAFLPYCALVPIIGVPAWQLDGLFLGATEGRTLRYAAVTSTLAYVGIDLALRPRLGNHGVWLAFLAMYPLRALTLGVGVPGLWRRLEASAPPSRGEPDGSPS